MPDPAPAAGKGDLARWRQTIDNVDAELVALLNRRAEAARAIGERKRADGAPIYVPHREQQVFERVCGLNRGPLPDAALRSIWREIMSASLALERPLTICHFAGPGSFTHLAARLKFGDGVRYHSAATIAEVFAVVERGHADYGVVPIENSTDGGITDTIDAFCQTRLRIVGEFGVRVRHHLMARCPREAIRRVYSKHTVFGQCAGWLAANLAGVERIEIGSTTQAAERAAREEGAAAIGNREAADEYGLDVLAQDVEDNPTNTTRFVVLADPRLAAQPSGDDKTSLMFGLRNRPGALYDSLVPFHGSGINLCRIESRPSRRQPWEYVFFIDILGHERDAAVAEAIERLAGMATSVQILGSYPRTSRPLND